MKRIGLVAVALLVVVVGVVLAGTPRGEKQVQDWIIGAPEKADSAAFTFAGSIDTSGEKPVLTTAGGKRIELGWENDMAAKTQITDVFTVTARLTVFAWTGGGGGGAAHRTQTVGLELAGVGAVSIVTDYQEHEGNVMLRVDRTLALYPPPVEEYGEPPYSDTVWIGLDDQYHSFDISLYAEATVMREVSENPIGAKTGVTHAKEMTVADSWRVAVGQTIRAEIDGFVIEGVREVDPTEPAGSTMWITIIAGGHAGPGGQDYCRVEDISFNGAKIDASRLDELLEPDAGAGPSWTGIKMRVYGTGATIALDSTGWIASAAFNGTQWCTAPYYYSFTGLTVKQMDGTELSDLIVCCPAVQRYTAGTWATVCQTVAEWQAATYVSQWGPYSWDVIAPPEGTIHLTPHVSFRIQAASAQAHGLEGFQA